MNKKYLSLIPLAGLLVLAAGFLAGCGDQSDTVGMATPTVQTPEDQAAAETPATSTPAISDTELDQQVKDMDASLDTIKTTCFEAGNLSNKDLGL